MMLLEMVAQSLKATADGGNSQISGFFPGDPVLLTDSINTGRKVESQRQSSKDLWGWNLDSPWKSHPGAGLVSSGQPASVHALSWSTCESRSSLPIPPACSSKLRGLDTWEPRFMVTCHQ